MAFAPPKIPDGSALRLRLSSWTPLNHQRINHKVFEERRALLGKWFDKWTDGQRRRILLDLLERCSPSQQKFCAGQLRVPVEAVDFSTTLPRVLSLHIFSFLDPRSLCRCAQVSWPWKELSELDQLWMPKCCRFGWRLGPGPSPAAPGAWKKLYVAMVRELRIARPETPAKAQLVVAEAQPGKRRGPEGKRSVGTTRELRPWRPADRNPADTAQSYNHLDNLDPTEQARRARSRAGGNSPELSGQQGRSKKREIRGSAPIQEFSLPADPEPIPNPPSRPIWARPVRPGAVPAPALARSSGRISGMRPGPVRAPAPRPGAAGDATRADTASPPPPPFEAQPWHVPSSDHGSDTE